MKAIVFDRFGPAENLRLEDVPTPEPGAGEILVKLDWTAVNHLDIDVRNGVSNLGIRLPHVMGTEGAGTVAAVGAGVTAPGVGDRVATQVILSCGRCEPCLRGADNLCRDFKVLGSQVWGCYAQYVCVPAHRVVTLPAGLSTRDVIAGQKYPTAWEALIETAKLRPGESVLVTGAAGGLGSACVQVAVMAGANVIAAAGDDWKLEQLKSLGATGLINYRREDITEAARRLSGGGVAVVAETVGGAILQAAIRSLAPGGRVCVLGGHGGEQVEIDIVDMFRRHISLMGCGRQTRAINAEVYRHMAAGRLAPVVARELPLAEAAEGHRLMESRGFFGRILLRAP